MASLRAEASAATAAAAQTRVNDAVASAVAATRAVPTVTSGTGAYQVWHVTDPRDAWQASQTLRLTSHDGTALLTLVGRLQSKGLAMDGLDWRLSDALAEHTRDEAMRRAIAMLRGRATQAADLLGLRFDSFKSVTLNEERPAPVAPRAMMAMKAATPTAVSEDITVTATAEADAILQPK